ncbi:HlyC/CorC family transporter [Solirubrobacter sp. CPCC 204708]|uniref:Hemolysin family protein n=1 Tax=Solirubrobacter deserti TaxID=2282478 RepID=A0ABT4RUN1_9ACTN|nr:hemolysin family protein [Solirubrobacter deserti]MBE2319336.1 HlyC/CorC family transporter [Solirubrobacter deserti]MDA0142302.1 hemolysin family protein [Solirubrobacter deserti]
MSTSLAIGISVFLLAANAFFVGAEFALISARRSAIEPRAAEGSRAARTTLRAMENVSLMMAGAQLGITICSLGLGYLGEPAIAHFLEGPFESLGVPEGLVHPIAFAIALGLIGFLHVVLGEMVPKNIALAGPDRAAIVLGPPLALVVRVLHPAIAVLNWIANRTLRAVGVQPQDEVTSAFTRDEVAGLVSESGREGILDANEQRLLIGALEFEERRARNVLLELDDVEAVPVDVTPAQVEDVAGRTGYSRFPVQENGELIGYLHLKDALEFEDRHRNRPIARAWIRDLAVVDAADPLRVVLATMQRSNAHLARVDDADGRVLGVAALEDVLEELVGEIRDDAALRT